MRSFFEAFLQSDYRDCIGPVLRSIGNQKLHYLKSRNVTNWLLEELVERNMLWCIPYLRGAVNNRDYYDRIIKNHCQEIIYATVTGVFSFSTMLHKIIRYDSENDFFIMNLPDYLSVLFMTSIDRHVVQRLLIEICSTKIFNEMVRGGKLLAIYRVLESSPDRFFYLDAFCYALKDETQRSCLKTIILDELERLTAGKTFRRSLGGGILHRREKYARCAGLECYAFICSNYCELNRTVTFGELLAMLRFALANK